MDEARNNCLHLRQKAEPRRSFADRSFVLQTFTTTQRAAAQKYTHEHIAMCSCTLEHTHTTAYKLDNRLLSWMGSFSLSPPDKT